MNSVMKRIVMGVSVQIHSKMSQSQMEARNFLKIADFEKKSVCTIGCIGCMRHM